MYLNEPHHHLNHLRVARERIVCNNKPVSEVFSALRSLQACCRACIHQKHYRQGHIVEAKHQILVCTVADFCQSPFRLLRTGWMAASLTFHMPTCNRAAPGNCSPRRMRHTPTCVIISDIQNGKIKLITIFQKGCNRTRCTPVQEAWGATTTGPLVATAASMHTICLYSPSPISLIAPALASPGFHSTASTKPSMLNTIRCASPASSNW